jgi:hypothetical protein
MLQLKVTVNYEGKDLLKSNLLVQKVVQATSSPYTMSSIRVQWAIWLTKTSTFSSQQACFPVSSSTKYVSR